ncbi:hypothetical protein CXF59_00925 [Flavobacterium sp. ALD4]|jgi:hypothetical protein|uniref:hypothetical protein n=1 Tax=Flavobacterium sp. ALD4 TaxID=2058314 RepID=UPI000C321B88|nr:hypothetical protein [Flavobacterium sp. ALD4]PKH68872.1 hypothetical protein CXF59_00925 [Flavobacterium sp. ALD4]
MKRLLLTNWHAMRWIRLVIGLFLIQQAVQYQQLIFGFMAAFFLFQAIFNTGCGLNGCEVSTFKKNKNE